MPFIIRGVRMFSGWPDEESPEGGLRRVHRLCGLTLGGDDHADGLEFAWQDFSQRSQSASHLSLVALNGQLIDPQDETVNRSGIGQSVGPRTRKLPR